MKFRFPVIIIDEDFRSENSSGSGVRALADAIVAEGVEVKAMTSYGDLSAIAQQQSFACAFVLSIDDEEFESAGRTDEAQAVFNLRRFITQIRKKNAEIPIYIYGETRTSQHLPNDILRELHGFIHMFEDTPEFVARHIIREAKSYLNSIAPPFFKALVEYAQDGTYSWHSPGHSGGVAFLKSPAGQMFHQFFGENMLRADACTSVDELGGLLDHVGPIAASERNAARIYYADHCYFVTNGTSTSNKMVWHSAVAPNDVVLVDRNCHKSILHSIMMIGAIPVFLKPTRNHLGIIGPIPAEQFEPAHIEKLIQAHPLAKHSGQTRPRIMTLTQSTYDGILYNVETIKAKLDGYIANLHFDEAWVPHGAFHPFYKDMTALGEGRARAQHSLVFATQSTHKLLAGISQASQVLVQDAVHTQLDHHTFNQAYLMHASTSPQYAIIASCDVAAAMMEPPGGTALVEESILEAMDFRRAMRKIGSEIQIDAEQAKSELRASWWFDVWEPDAIASEGIGQRDAFVLGEGFSGNDWHSFGRVQPGFNMLDPIKVTIVNPGLDHKGAFAEAGIPANIVTKYLAEHGIVVEKTGLYSFFVMFTIGITKGRWNTLLSALQQFKDDFDRNGLMGRTMPEFCLAHPQYERIGLRDLCQALHATYQQHDIARVTMEMYISDMEPVMRPADAWAAVAHRQIDRVAIDDLEGRVTSALLTPYPPGIPLLIPGEKINRTIVQYLQFARQFNEKYPGLDTDIHGLVQKDGQYFVDCVSQAGVDGIRGL
jgi:arginine decarboxylase